MNSEIRSIIERKKSNLFLLLLVDAVSLYDGADGLWFCEFSLGPSLLLSKSSDRCSGFHKMAALASHDALLVRESLPPPGRCDVTEV